MKVVILGTAHLKTTPGKCSPNGLFREYEYSREIVNDIACVLRGYGYMVLIDYASDEPCEQMKSMTFLGSKELCYRVNYVNTICEEYGKDNVVYVSVHVNAAGADGQWHGARGWSVYTSPGESDSDELANLLLARAKSNLPPGTKMRVDYTDGDGDIEAKFYVLTMTRCAAVLTENLFQDNREDVDFLLSEEGRHAVVRLHVEGILDFIGER